MNVSSATPARNGAPAWEYYPRATDIGVRGRGETREKAFEQAALAMMATIADPDSIRALEGPVFISYKAPNDHFFLADWLNALLLEMNDRNMLFRRFDVSIKNGRLAGQAWGERIDSLRHRPRLEIKGAAYDTPDVWQETDGTWVAECAIYM